MNLNFHLTLTLWSFFQSSQGQIEYVQLLSTYGKPIVLVQIQGRPRLMHDAVASADAVINAYQPGTLSYLQQNLFLSCLFAACRGVKWTLIFVVVFFSPVTNEHKFNCTRIIVDCIVLHCFLLSVSNFLFLLFLLFLLVLTGPKGGLAIAEALAGVLVPSGRLPFK